MRPRTTFEKKCLDIFHKNFICPAEIRDWAIAKYLNTVDGFPGYSRKSIICYCSRCGAKTPITDSMQLTDDHEWTYVCKGCGTKVVMRDSLDGKRVVRQRNTFCVYRVIDGTQFIFFYALECLLRKCYPISIECKSYGCVAFNESKWVCVRKTCSHAFKTVKDFSVTFFAYKDDMKPSNLDVYPQIELLPVLKYRGFDMDRENPVWGMIADFKSFMFFVNPRFVCLEVASKRNDFDFIQTLKEKWDSRNLYHEYKWKDKSSDELALYNRPYIIANRHHYIAEDWKLWMDMVSMLEIVRKDIHNPKYICPHDLRAGHDFAQECYDIQSERWEKKRKRERFENGPFDVYWHAEFNPEFNEETFPHFLREYGIANIVGRKQECEEAGHECPILLYYTEEFMDDETGETFWIVNSKYLSKITTDEDGNAHYWLPEEYANIGLEISPDNIVLNPEVLKGPNKR